MNRNNEQVTFLPLLNEPCSFDLLIYTNKTAVVPEKWADSDPQYIMNSQEVKLRSFTTSVSDNRACLNSFHPPPTLSYGKIYHLILRSLVSQIGFNGHLQGSRRVGSLISMKSSSRKGASMIILSLVESKTSTNLVHPAHHSKTIIFFCNSYTTGLLS